MNKRIIAFILTTIMIVCNSMVVWADTTENGITTTGDKQHDVTASFNVSNEKIICVDIVWGDMKFKYDGTVAWDQDNNYYKATTDVATWTPTRNTITVTNRSSDQINVAYGYQLGNDNKVTGVNGTCNPTNATIKSKATDGESAEIVSTSTLTLNGKPTQVKGLKQELLNGIVIGQVTLTIS